MATPQTYGVESIMTERLFTVTPETTVQEAATIMADEDIGALPVVDGTDFVGIVTDRDIVVRVLSDRSIDPRTARVSLAMTPELAWIHIGDRIDDAVARIAELQIRRLGVVDDDGRLVGMISVGDIARTDSPETAGKALKEVCSDVRS